MDTVTRTVEQGNEYLSIEDKKMVYAGILDGLKQLTMSEFQSFKNSFEIPVSVQTMALLFNCTDRSVQMFSKEKKISKEYRGRYLLIESIWLLIRHYRYISSRDGGDATLDGLRKEGQRLDNELKTLELEKEKNNLISTAEVQKAAFERHRKVRDAIENIPSRISDILAAENDGHKINEILSKEIHQALEELSK